MWFHVPSGKTASIWDTLTHERSGLIAGNSTGDIACDSYHKYKEDVAMLKQMGVSNYYVSPLPYTHLSEILL